MPDNNAVLEMMAQSEAAYIATVSGGAPRIRALVNLRRRDLYPEPSEFCAREGFVSYFLTSAASGKAADIRVNPSVAVYYSDPRRVHGVELRGRAEILTGPEIKKTLWQEIWRVYWNGPEDPDCIVLRLKPERAAGWWGSAPFQLDLDGA